MGIEIRNVLKGEEFELKNVERIPHHDYATLISRYCNLLYEKFDTRLRSIVLFGSIARGDWKKDSDIDLLIVVDEWNKSLWDRLEELYEVKRKLADSSEFERTREKGYWPSIRHYPLSTEEAKKTQRIYLDMILDGIILYDRDDLIENVLTRVKNRLRELGARRVEIPGKRPYWILRSEIKFGDIEI